MEALDAKQIVRGATMMLEGRLLQGTFHGLAYIQQIQYHVLTLLIVVMRGGG
jgi:hypothetical protein